MLFHLLAAEAAQALVAEVQPGECLAQRRVLGDRAPEGPISICMNIFPSYIMISIHTIITNNTLNIAYSQS